MLTALILVLSASGFETEYEVTAPRKQEASVFVSTPTDQSSVARALPNPDAASEGRQSADATLQQDLDVTKTPEHQLASPYRIPLTILTALVCGLLFLFFRQTE